LRFAITTFLPVAEAQRRHVRPPAPTGPTSSDTVGTPAVLRRAWRSSILAGSPNANDVATVLMLLAYRPNLGGSTVDVSGVSLCPAGVLKGKALLRVQGCQLIRGPLHHSDWHIPQSGWKSLRYSEEKHRDYDFPGLSAPARMPDRSRYRASLTLYPNHNLRSAKSHEGRF
jgi:hypothetical protein